MKKEHILILLERVEEMLISSTPENWPNGINYEVRYDERIINKMQFTLKRCFITLWESSSGKGISLQFSVGSNCINSSYEAPNFFVRWLCPVWRTWKRIKWRLMYLHKQNKKIIAKKELDEQIAVFNNLYYTQFPDDIDDIFLDDED
jgi:hypothetical protein